MSGENKHGEQGERIVEQLLRYGGWTIVECQALVHGHYIDLVADHPYHGETLFEVKVWANPKNVGTDNVKKAMADASDLRLAGEQRDYILVLSHDLAGLYKVMLNRLVDAGVITDVWILALVPMGRSVLP